MSEFLFPYDLKTEALAFADLRLQIEGLRDVEATIDTIFEILKKENRSELLEELCPYFGVVWPAAVGLTQYMRTLLGKENVADLSVVELGCGLGLPGLFLAKSGIPVVCTDQHPDVPVFLARNKRHNDIRGLEYRSFDWMKETREIEAPTARSWVIGSDILYESQHPKTVAEAIARVLSTGTERVIIADPGRPYLQQFAQEMKHVISHTPEIQIERCATGNHVGKEVFVLDFRRA